MAVLVACTGTIYDRPGSGGSGPSATATGDAPLLDSPGALPLRRLTRDEYSNTILDLFGVRVAGDEFASDAVGASGFYTPSGVSDAEVRNYLVPQISGFDRLKLRQEVG